MAETVTASSSSSSLLAVIPISLHSSSDNCSSSSTSSIFQSLQRHSEHLLGKCISFLSQRDRNHICCTNRFFFSASCSPASWQREGTAAGDSASSFLLSADGLQATAMAFAKEQVKAVQLNQEVRFSFRNAEVQCRIRDLPPFKSRNRLFTHSRCLALSWCEVTELEAIRYLSNDTFTCLQHIYMGAALWPTARSVLLPSVQLPSSLVSFTVEVDDAPNLDGLLFVPMLPASLRTLQLIVRKKSKWTVSLQKLTQLERFSVIWASEDIKVQNLPVLPLDSLKLCPEHLPNLRIHNDLSLLPILEQIFKTQQLQVDSPSAILCTSLIHLHIPSCKLLAPPMWAAALPNLSSLRIESFTFASRDCEPPVHNLPIALGERIRTLVIDQAASDKAEDPSTSFAHCFASSGLTNLTSLTFNRAFTPSRGLFQNLNNLTYLSCKLRYDEEEQVTLDFAQFAPLRNLTSLQLNEWPDQYLDSTNRITPENRIHEAMGDGNVSTSVSNVTIASNQSPASLADFFPSLTELSVTAATRTEEPEVTCCYDARNSLCTIPHLQFVNWGREPPIHPNAIEAYYSEEAILARETKRLREKKAKIDACRAIDWWTYIGTSTIDATGVSSITKSRGVAHMELILLTRVLQLLTVMEVTRASIANKHWRGAATSPLMVQHPLRIETTPWLTRPAKVHGSSLKLRDDFAMFQAANSDVVRNVRIVCLTAASNPLQLPRESHFASFCLRSFVQLRRFTKLHTLELDWNLEGRVNVYDRSIYLPRSKDIETIRQVIDSPAFKHLKVFRMHAPAPYIYTMLRFLPAMKELEVVELQYLSCTSHLDKHGPHHHKACAFANQLVQLPSLKQASIFQRVPRGAVGQEVEPQLEELHRLCTGVAAANSFEGVAWKAPISESSLDFISEQFRVHKMSFPKLKSLRVEDLNGSLASFSNATAAMPDLCDVTIGSVTLNLSSESVVCHLDEQFVRRLRSLKLRVYSTQGSSTASNKGPRAVALLESLVASPFTNLECLHLTRNYTSDESDHESEVKLKQLLVKLVDGCREHISEVNFSNFELSKAHWESILPQLTVVHSDDAVLPLLNQCQQLREFHAPNRPSRDVLSELLQLPYFESVSYSPNEGGEPIISTRAGLAEQQRKWVQADGAAAMRRRNSC